MLCDIDFAVSGKAIFRECCVQRLLLVEVELIADPGLVGAFA
jgi:hypothetical protein